MTQDGVDVPKESGAGIGWNAHNVAGSIVPRRSGSGLSHLLRIREDPDVKALSAEANRRATQVFPATTTTLLSQPDLRSLEGPEDQNPSEPAYGTSGF